MKKIKLKPTLLRYIESPKQRNASPIVAEKRIIFPISDENFAKDCLGLEKHLKVRAANETMDKLFPTNMIYAIDVDNTLIKYKSTIFPTTFVPIYHVQGTINDILNVGRMAIQQNLMESPLNFDYDEIARFCDQEHKDIYHFSIFKFNNFFSLNPRSAQYGLEIDKHLKMEVLYYGNTD